LGHDLKSPFNSILGFLSLLTENIHTYDIKTIENHLNIIQKTAIQTYNLLNDLLLWSKAQSGKLSFNPQKIVFYDICVDVINSLKYHSENKNIVVNCFEQVKTILNVDLNMFKIILRNLISNAIKFSNNRGVINIYTEKNIDEVTITVSDNGIGIDENILRKLWDYTLTASTLGTAGEKGTGFGLLLCKDFVEKHNGRIWVETKHGKGSDFKFTIPY